MIFLVFNRTLFFSEKDNDGICVEMIQNLGGWHRDSRNVQM